MKKQRNTIIILALACVFFVFSACSSLDSKYKPGHYANQEIWVCDEVDMWFAWERWHEGYSRTLSDPNGELKLNDEIIPIDFATTTGHVIAVFKPADPEAGIQFQEVLFGGSGRFRKRKFKMTLPDDFFGDGTEKLTFRLLENDDERAKEYLETYNSWFE